MIDTKFTKGEWKDIDNGHYIDVYAFDDEGWFISQVCMGVAYEEKENAPLIAKSKDMYKMLESVIGELHMLIDEVNDQRASRINSQTETEPDYHDMETIHDIQVLLAQARGEL